MNLAYRLTQHARERSTARTFPPLIAETIIAFGRSVDGGDGTRKYALTKESMRELRRFGGRTITNALAPYHRRNAYVVEAASSIITVAFASKPLFR
ncbi:hypothetical protein [Propylenella binzhouense]|uniref:Uncharacterized protein n=1 Tax=Propylenella binzhouense TaxID=2555902 RepID=A0A964T4Q1_9HYPH|nr:hypothetical protein [Propylenella binzhouense]MYZ48345.1 hypothetical protein [Propylenella binzhouense]